VRSHKALATCEGRYDMTVDHIQDGLRASDVKRLFSAFLHEESGPVSSLTWEPLFLPGTREVEDALADMQRRKAHMAVVLDEYCGTTGIVTMEDLLEEIVGEIYDEDDEGEAAPNADTEGLTVPGDTELEDLNEWIRLPTEDEYTTGPSADWCPDHLGRLPRPGDQVDLNELTLAVVAMDDPRVTQVRLVRVEKLNICNSSLKASISFSITSSVQGSSCLKCSSSGNSPRRCLSPARTRGSIRLC